MTRSMSLPAVLLTAGSCHATVLNVPDDFATIQAAINAAIPGDTVLVADGSYSGPGNVNIDTLGKAITVRSVNGGDFTWIEGDEMGFVVQSGETALTVIQGFSFYTGGSGLFISDSSPTVIDCQGDYAELHNSSSTVTDSYFHYGFSLSGGAPTLTDCLGSAYAKSSDLILAGCDFGGTEQGEALVVNGGSLQASECKFNDCVIFGRGVTLINTTAVLISCDISGNRDETDSAEGGGIALYGASATLVDCTIRNNQVGEEYFGFGGGAFIDAASQASFIGCLIEGNTAFDHFDEGGWGGGVYAAGLATYANCEILSNRAPYGAGTYSSGADELIGCTLFGNLGGAAVRAVESTTLANCIIYGNGAGSISGAPAITYSNVEGGYTGAGNIDAAPMFLDAPQGDFRLAPGAPGIDAGDNTVVPEGLTTDIAGLPRFVDDPDTADTGIGPPPVVDMGAHEFQVPCYPDLNGDGALDLFDFLAFVNAFNAGDLLADCTPDIQLDMYDFLCFVNAFNKGC
jgi:hypothetical protein